MLDNLFRLDGTPRSIGPHEPIPDLSPDTVVSNIIFNRGLWVPNTKRIRRVRFCNVSFSGTQWRQLTFTECHFEDCLFLGTRFDEIEFHGCKFINCNLWKSRFYQVYIDPLSIKLDRRFKSEAANVGVTLFQSLLSNFSEEQQDRFYRKADIRFRRWKRYQISSDLNRKRISVLQAWKQWIANISSEIFTGFGYKPVNFFVTTIAVFLLVSYINFIFIGNSISINAGQSTPASFVDTIFYTFSILTVLGFSSILPVTAAAKLLTVFEALLAVAWLGIFTAIFVKRFLR